MNIVVLTYSGKVVTRPETTRKKEHSDLYLPDFVGGLSFSDALFLRIKRPGRSIPESFAHTHFESWCNGMLLYPENFIDGSEEGFATASCLDYTSIIPYSYSPAGELSDKQLSLAAKAVSECSRFCFLRTGDFVAVELNERKHLCSRQDGILEIKDFNFNIHF